MATHTPSLFYPARLEHMRYARNGMPANGALARALAEATNHIVAYRRKCVALKSLDWGAIPLGASGTATPWHWAFHSGQAVSQLEGWVGLAICDNALAVDPYVDCRVGASYGAGAFSTSNEIHYAAINTDRTGDTPPDDVLWGRLQVALTADTDYSLELRAVDYARPVAGCFYETATIPVDDAVLGVVDPQLGVGSPVLDNHLSALLTAHTGLWQNNPGAVLSWSRDSAASAPTHSGVQATNILDSNSTSVTGATPGFRVHLRYHTTSARTSVPVLLAVRAQRTAGAQDVANDLVRITTGTASITVTGIMNTEKWYTTTGTMPATDGQKWDIHAASNAADTIRIDAVCVLEWE